MKIKVFFFVSLVCVILSVVMFTPLFQDSVKIQEATQTNLDFINTREKFESQQITEVSSEQIFQGDLLLVNSEHPMHEAGIKSDIVNLFNHADLTTGYGLLNSDIYLSKDVAQQFSAMVKAAAKDGINHFVISSGFRNFEEQEKLYQKMGDDYALPAGYSEHNLGLSLDVGSTQLKMEVAPEGKWIENNAWKYGFVLRYPQDKTQITGIQYEPWHIRYVGLPHSAVMHENNFVLEEYLEYLKEVKDISVTIKGIQYTVSYRSFRQGMAIHLPSNHQYTISGDNIEGIIVTEYE
ncbi:VanY-A/VanY-F/VanY-M family D-Ala-D-Ala carboxypeptidase [Sporosarcina sp. Te-1]|uniref:VanY-A/VanY-F/VanY-M family D-Ala-D-Ala carboxypeptidase n=1 Tax=Sporosarcina sp. Te-1 TaxID=2818390 RepID=UPI001A9EAA21|nr:VanY-A/VanY-F/VanY-M family D-Ala-D-Ala carboxypeptidase [Sporosarcina sp. Te-1]QTD40987.1 VanY-A/VanY-F/VanY-M family D-Ala-D-Ala carboxypeptidase [Sporosarcina sp. Te-1]